MLNRFVRAGIIYKFKEFTNLKLGKNKLFVTDMYRKCRITNV